MEKHSYSNALNRAFLILNEKNIDNEVAVYLMEEMMQWTHTKFLLHQNEIMEETDYNRFFEMITKASQNHPPQYILGEAWFYGRKFKVTPDTLIPRQETEELVSQVLHDINKEQGLDILDIGTGTGDILITLSLEKPDNHYLGLDISKEALEVAQTNANNLAADVEFIQSDLFQQVTGQFDVITSNPPYIADEERSVMDQSVLQFEPELALFADDNGLAIYRKIFTKIDQFLKPKGRAYFEFGYHQKEQLEELINKQLPEFEVEFYRDLTDNWRYLKMYRKEEFN
ncbi:release factor glutamine methyltransferase [Companilactobacillus sp. RD055328]|uniref:peptide chain release factor N(5)-glutamine methyltransferase n=1 Tax=Companilactobacillus sp. RD055328 TaxID=2916634 RepID=UPI001FC8B4C7|nr:peptide chain release factor N(5)-glutamine methyltransferase [Companilactobacillus sp. RD055328]GKQ42890.1 release factor glutamine methyltransferase [Companilactobacillus sp. RD055328]